MTILWYNVFIESEERFLAKAKRRKMVINVVKVAATVILLGCTVVAITKKDPRTVHAESLNQLREILDNLPEDHPSRGWYENAYKVTLNRYKK